ncbi:MAG: UDP-N-acetylmuramate dehydrogenase [Paraglaciecola sp.]|nr:UDP-N-acetylmuramate dehydrogenase [Paraglaciecola sp.]
MYSLQTLHTFGFPVHAANVQLVTSLQDIQQNWQEIKRQHHYILGEGSNTVFLENFLGSIYKIAIKGISLRETDQDFILKVGAGENWHQLVEWCLSQGIAGFENLALIPGTVGAAPIQNIGAYGVEVEQFITSIEYLCLASGTIKTIAHADCEFAYRDSVFKQALAGQIVIGYVTFRLCKNWVANANYAELRELPKPTARDIFNKVVQVRQLKLPDPQKVGNAGSFFKNPIIDKALFEYLQQRYPSLPSYPIDSQKVKVPAAWFIDTLGFKGRSVGGVQCHVSQPLVLTNNGMGNGDELLRLARQIKQTVKEHFLIELENEVQLVSNTGLIRV